MRRFDAAGSPLTTEILVNTYTTNNQQNPAIAMNSTGNFVVVWESQGQDGSGYGIYAQRFNVNAVTIGSEMQVNSTPANDQTSPSVAMSDSGDFVVTWTSKNQDPGSTDGVYARQFTSGVWGAEFRVNSTTSDDQFDPAVAMNKATGDFVIVWTSEGQDSGSTDGVYGRLFNCSRHTPSRAEFRSQRYVIWKPEYGRCGHEQRGRVCSDVFAMTWSLVNPELDIGLLFLQQGRCSDIEFSRQSVLCRRSAESVRRDRWKWRFRCRMGKPGSGRFQLRHRCAAFQSQ